MKPTNNLYFSSLFNKEINLIANSVSTKFNFYLFDVKDNPLLKVDEYSDVYSIIPLFNVPMVEGIDENGKPFKHLNIVSSNPNDIVSDRGIVCEKNYYTLLSFR